MVLYKDMPHGFLNYGIPNGISCAKMCVKESCAILAEIMNGSDEKAKMK